MDWMEFVRTSWPIFLALTTLIVVLAKMHSDIQIIKDKIKTLFDLFNRTGIKNYDYILGIYLLYLCSSHHLPYQNGRSLRYDLSYVSSYLVTLSSKNLL